jgi:hypothetical protein
MEPYPFLLILYTHLQSIRLRPRDGGTKCQVLLHMRAQYSESMEAFQFGLDRAEEISPSSPVVERNPYRTVPSVHTLGLEIPA